MLKEQRFEFITNWLKSHPVARLEELSLALRVSEDTIRRDIDWLAANELCQKVRGGAMAFAPSGGAEPFKNRMHTSESQKKVICQKALPLILPGQTIILDGGTTTFMLAAMLPVSLPVTIITTSFPVAHALLDHPLANIIFAGGKVFKSSQVTVGQPAIDLLRQMRADICFMGVCSLHPVHGMTNAYFEETEVKKNHGWQCCQGSGIGHHIQNWIGRSFYGMPHTKNKYHHYRRRWQPGSV